ncbi:MAG: Threonine-tRNA ligase [Candidatus Nomurabacteria bacterium GW2011_GWF2_35_66]|uniref:Threonine--tRNA ligase n=1 Tax=Candidatus Nomurabacteria bacterium GW2011_GWE1_35_16 TaxID=1618761 RepID=A0A0G0BSS4_9BACT|nr:MAG: Threonine-tRNA ligase [Candidatus Nomurabacteria bacterium GW2011_GWF1_34_20]KKP63549.1 MAG: Threonine-tRNA ligase [Candidatus Nomurabacteria bacterium GW2011_GWE2_34_25]KKP66741.1 MAG: Threonine-tRNA ligase [Candidatus Nomurabacteria bacterium GW2011_GWE1_35_16]KKP83841.1 MAG: Threonine-tRNA ligase [Candidatus Nomurabacteria bacterium GW2011_GWF2_35_66]HAE36370.1 threonine--tRNA ligase [Candidatus Nomurabacteria bacterium]
MENKNLEHVRHSLAHLLGASILELYPGSQITLGPAVDNGFYYDVDIKGKITDTDLEKVEAKMKELLKTWTSFEKEVLSKEEALKMFAGNVYKEELINGIVEKGEEITIYKSGNFSDLCRGGHIDNMKNIKEGSWKLERIAGAYWRGDEKNKMLTRIYGLAFNTKEELDAYITLQEEAKKRDHRELGKKLELFTFDEEIGKGLPIWLPKGNIIKEELENWAKETEQKWGYQRVTTPIITKESLFYTSGHLPLYKDSMYAPISIEGDNYYIKPMNCPFHHKVFSALPKSYKDLPLRLAEYGWCHRYEDSGSLFGLMRVRGMQMNDAHIYTTPEQAIQEFIDVIKLHEYYYKVLGIEKYEMELALRDPKKMDKYHGEEKDWKLAEEMTIEAMEISGVPFKIAHEGAAFYGPKMDFQVYSSIGRSFSASTNQLDLYMGKKFNLEYTDKDGTKKTPYIIHRAPLGTHERFIGFLIEHFAGAFPLWLSPVQVIVLPISEHQHEYANSVYKTLKDSNIRVELDDSNESLGKRIRDAKMSKTPYVIVIGDKERDAKVITVEGRTEKLEGITIESFLERLQKEIKERTLN